MDGETETVTVTEIEVGEVRATLNISEADNDGGCRGVLSLVYRGYKGRFSQGGLAVLTGLGRDEMPCVLGQDLGWRDGWDETGWGREEEGLRQVGGEGEEERFGGEGRRGVETGRGKGETEERYEGEKGEGDRGKGRGWDGMRQEAMRWD
ncbi:hypothetical protein Pmani_028686 [Petrolisthes manimaculis]|uniref:Uncharacterized protein n=1 Tax=Petrolisthes manimaculis TaxID=1843537 RepID=A0AAE1P1K4_9EUCA|nr:hypothetical protein Pmani_028686 [Petrolisthes manimaculis]